jgi:hypothetical protein
MGPTGWGRKRAMYGGEPEVMVELAASSKRVWTKWSLVPPLSVDSSRWVAPGDTSRMSRSPSAVWVMPVRKTMALVTAPPVGR